MPQGLVRTRQLSGGFFNHAFTLQIHSGSAKSTSFWQPGYPPGLGDMASIKMIYPCRWPLCCSDASGAPFWRLCVSVPVLAASWHPLPGSGTGLHFGAPGAALPDGEKSVSIPSPSSRLGAPPWQHQGAEPGLYFKPLIFVKGKGDSDQWKMQFYFSPSFPAPPSSPQKIC